VEISSSLLLVQNLYGIKLLLFMKQYSEIRTYEGEKHIVLVGKPEGKRPFGRPRRRWQDTMKMNLK
jgi:hypothetical protein